MVEPTYIQWGFAVVSGLFVYFAKRAIAALDKQIETNCDEITDIKERVTGYSLDLTALRYELYGKGVIESHPAERRLSRKDN